MFLACSFEARVLAKNRIVQGDVFYDAVLIDDRIRNHGVVHSTIVCYADVWSDDARVDLASFADVYWFVDDCFLRRGFEVVVFLQE